MIWLFDLDNLFEKIIVWLVVGLTRYLNKIYKFRHCTELNLKILEYEIKSNLYSSIFISNQLLRTYKLKYYFVIKNVLI